MSRVSVSKVASTHAHTHVNDPCKMKKFLACKLKVTWYSYVNCGMEVFISQLIRNKDCRD